MCGSIKGECSNQGAAATEPQSQREHNYTFAMASGPRSLCSGGLGVVPQGTVPRPRGNVSRSPSPRGGAEAPSASCLGAGRCEGGSWEEDQAGRF